MYFIPFILLRLPKLLKINEKNCPAIQKFGLTETVSKRTVTEPLCGALCMKSPIANLDWTVRRSVCLWQHGRDLRDSSLISDRSFCNFNQHKWAILTLFKSNFHTVHVFSYYSRFTTLLKVFMAYSERAFYICDFEKHCRLLQCHLYDIEHLW